jgi:hypothetical protein
MFTVSSSIIKKEKIKSTMSEQYPLNPNKSETDVANQIDRIAANLVERTNKLPADALEPLEDNGRVGQIEFDRTDMTVKQSPPEGEPTKIYIGHDSDSAETGDEVSVINKRSTGNTAGVTTIRKEDGEKSLKGTFIREVQGVDGKAHLRVTQLPVEKSAHAAAKMLSKARSEVAKREIHAKAVANEKLEELLDR